MNMKSLKSQFIAAIAMVLVAAIAMGSSTFAWFAGNNIVTAQTMKVQAVAEDGIEIVFKGQSDWSKIDASEVTDAMVLYPTSTQSGTTWVHATAQAASAFTASAGSYELLTLSAGNTENDIAGYSSGTHKQLASQKYDAGGRQYYRLDTFQIRTVQGTAAAQKVKVKEITVSGTPAALDKSLRVLIKSGDNYFNYNAGGGNTTRNVATSVTTTGAIGNPATIAAVTYKPTNEASTLLCTCATGTSSAPGDAQDVDIYIYYEGEDSEHFSENLDSALAELNVTVVFQADSSVSAYAAPAAPAAASAAQQAGTAAIN